MTDSILLLWQTGKGQRSTVRHGGAGGGGVGDQGLPSNGVSGGGGGYGTNG